MRISTILFCALCAVVAPTTASAQAIDGAPDGYKLVWQDDFNGTALDERAWNIEVSGTGGGNQELQYYRRENVSVENGNLVLTARREDYQGRSFTSGRVNSNQKTAFKHGVMQAKIKFPKTADGLWPAYWMMGNDINRYGWPRCGEIDIIEMGHANAITGKYAGRGWQDRYFSGTLHYGPDASNENHQQNSQEFSESKFTSMTPVQNDDYHIFTIEWDDKYLYMYYDLEAYTNAKRRSARYYSIEISYSDDNMTAGHYFQKAFYFLFNLAVGGTFPSIYDPAGITALPNPGDEAKMYVDWVRVYQKDGDENAQYYYTDENGEVQTNIEEEPEPEPEPDNKTELSSFATKALDDAGTSTFNFDDAYDVVLISTSQGVTGNFQSREAVLKDYNVDNTNNFLYIWDDTYYAAGRDGKTNSFGWGEGYNTYYVTEPATWSGLGFASPAGKGKDLSMLDDTYWLHFAIKGNDVEQHASHTIIVGNAEFRVGKLTSTLATIGDFRRDGEWYYYDIPLKAIRQFADPIFPKAQVTAYEGNVWAALSGGITDTELTFDNIFFYKSKSKEVPDYKDTASKLGRWGYKSVTETGASAFDLSQVGEMIPITLSEDMWKGVTGDGAYADENLVKREHDYTLDNNFYVWGDPQTLTGRKNDTARNSTGVFTGGITEWAHTQGQGWNGLGIATSVAKDLSMIDDSYYLHFAVRSDAALGHVPFTLRIGSESADAKITLGQYSSNSPLVGDFPRDGEWYAFDIPVSFLRQRYGQLWSKAVDGKLPAKEYLLSIGTSGTHYSGSYFAFDNVFFWKKADGSKYDLPELGEYTTKSLNEAGESYFSFDDKDFITVSTGKAEREMMGENIVGAVTIDDMTTHFYLWEETLKAGTKSGKTPNSFGIQNEYWPDDEGWIDLVCTGKGWVGGGIVSSAGIDMSLIDDNPEDWYMHFAVRGDEQTGRDLTFVFGKAHFTIGSQMYLDNDEPHVALGNFPRNGEWYSYDIPMTEFYQICPDLFPQDNGGPKAFTDNLLVLKMPNPKEGDEIQIDNLFFWRKHQETTGIDEAPRVVSKASVMSGVYDLSGRRVASDLKGTQLSKGIYIVNGKKIVIR